MPNKIRSASQARKDRAALKRLRASGIYTGKIDLRKAPTRYQLQKIKSLKGKRIANKKLPPKQKVPGAKISRRVISEKEVRKIPAKGGDYAMKTYALPFLRKGQEEPEWRRFTRSQLTQFLNEYKADDPEGRASWRSYAVEETWVFSNKSERIEFRRETEIFFSGVRIDQPKGRIKKKLRNKKKAKRSKRKA